MGRGLGRYLIGALLAVVAGVAALAVSAYYRHMADTQEYFAIGHYDRAEAALDAAAPYAGYARWIPWIGRGPSDDLRARAAALQYWRRDYAGLAGGPTDPVARVDADNVDLQLIVANAAYRVRRPRLTERVEAVRALDESIAAYFDVLAHEEWREDAAFNYEYLTRLRDALARGRVRPPGAEQEGEADRDALGAEGIPSVPAEGGEFEIYIPLEREEREEGDAGRTETRPRRG